MMPAPDYSHSWPKSCVTCNMSEPAPEQAASPRDSEGPACLGVNPGVFQTLGSRGSFLWQQLQHGQEERAELDGFLPRPLVLILQDFKQAPWLELRDVSQLSWTRLKIDW